MDVVAGLLKKNGERLPLRSVAVEGDIKGYLMGLVIRLIYENTEKDPVEVVFKMPLENSQAVVGLTAIIDGKKIRADLKEKEEAKAVYDDAIAGGQTAALGETIEDDVFSVSLGNLPNESKADIELHLVNQLPVDAEGKISFSLPTILKDRYTPVSDITPSTNTTNSDISGTVSGIDQIVLRIHNSKAIKSITSSTHVIRVEETDNDVQVVTMSNVQSDVVVQVELQEPHTPFAITEYGQPKEGDGDPSFMSNHVVMLNFFPEIPRIQVSSELIFLVDRSGSMSGSFIKRASETLVLFMKSIPEGCHFNIYGFGSSYVSLFPSSVPYNQRNLEKAMDHVLNLKADLGGTEILPPLDDIFRHSLIKNLPRQIFILTDGAVSNTSACIDKVKQNSHNARCFTFGIGSGASTSLVKGMAEAGNGTAEFVKEGERLQPKVVRSLKHALQPALTDVSVKFEFPGLEVTIMIPSEVRPIFDGEKLVIYGIIKASSDVTTSIEGQVTLEGKIGSEKVSHTIQVKDVAQDTTPMKFLLHHLAAKSQLAEMEEKGSSKEDIIKLSIESNVICKETTFVAVDEESFTPVQGPLTTYDLRQQIDEVMNLMRTNIDSAIVRGCALDDLADKSADLAVNAQMFSSKSKKSGGFFGGITSTISSWFSRSSNSQIPSSSQLSRERSNSSDNSDDSLSLEEEKEEGYMECLPNENEVENKTSHHSAVSAPKNIISDDFSAVIVLQQANGSWSLNDSLANFLSIDIKAIKESCPDSCTTSEVWATVLVVTALRMRFASRQDEWELVVMKADDWLKKQHSVEEVSRFYEVAKQVLA